MCLKGKNTEGVSSIKGDTPQSCLQLDEAKGIIFSRNINPPFRHIILIV
jgi:hypothetical protein